MMRTSSTMDEAIEAVTCGCVGCLTVTVPSLQLEADMPIGGWGGLFEQLNIKQVRDHVGRAITAAAAR